MTRTISKLVMSAVLGSTVIVAMPEESRANDMGFLEFFTLTFTDPIREQDIIQEDEDASQRRQRALEDAFSKDTPVVVTGGFGYTRTENVVRGTLATENPPGTLVNPALSLSSQLDGMTYDFSVATTVPQLFPGFLPPDPNILDRVPPILQFDFEGSFLDGNDRIVNQNLPNGLGITGVGQAPGVFIGGGPTDIRSATWDVDQDRIAAAATLGGPIWKDKQWFFASFAGARGGAIDQSERVQITTDSPAFGANSASTIRYQTEIDDRFAGVYGGVSAATTRSVRYPSASYTFFFGGSAYVGVDHHGTDVRDRVRATGLGGAVNVNQQIDIDVSETIFTAGASVSAGIQRGNFTLSISGGADYGKHVEFELQRPDSSAPGVPLPTVVDIEPILSYTGVIRATFKF